MAPKKAKFVPSAPADLPPRTPREIGLANVRYIQQAAALLEAALLAGAEPPNFVLRRIFVAAREAGTAVSGIQTRAREKTHD